MLGPETSPEDITIRKMTRDDLVDILAIERICFISPWSPKLFADTISFPLSRNFVMHVEGHLVGYALCYLIADEVHILNLAIAPEWRKRGLASRLLGHIIDALGRENALAFFLEVRESNEAAIRLYQRFGFKTIGRRKNYYTETHEDALVMRLLGADGHGCVT